MAKLFKYYVLTLIELVESKPCLWDKTTDSFKDKIEKQKAWKEVFGFFEKDFQQKDKNEQQKIGEVITGKWQNIRDSFVKSLKKKSGQATKKKYLYHENMQFLLKVVQSDETESSLEDSQREEEVDGEGDSEVAVQVDRNFGSRSETTTALENPPDEDEAFFISITPSVRKMSEEDKLDFRMNVLQLIRDIKRRTSNPRPLSSTSSSSRFSNELFPTLADYIAHREHQFTFTENSPQSTWNFHQTLPGPSTPTFQKL
ncbi:hypothetical protein FQR65_LT02381 [Abscondita terminalis]|nr:hypothetical protein FQR65_LT02381 [Abscondita terminalis]